MPGKVRAFALHDNGLRLVCVAFLLGSVPSSSNGCAICAEIPGASGLLGPRLLEIASAVRHEIDSGGLDRSAPGAPLPTGGRALGMRVARILENHPDANTPFELLLIDSGARFLFDPGKPLSGFSALDPKQKTHPPSHRWITNLDVFHALLNGHLAIDTAMVRGILVIEPVNPGDPLFDAYTLDGDSNSDSNIASDESSVRSGLLPGMLLLLSIVALVLLPLALVLRSARGKQTASPLQT